MMRNKKLHHNSQKRFYGPNKIYFITTNTVERFPFFKEDLFCQLFIDNLKICKHFRKFYLYGFILIPDHTHLIMEPIGIFNISEIMQYLKRHFSRQVNFIFGTNNEGEIGASNNEGEIGQSRLQVSTHKNFTDIILEHENKLKQIKNEFIKKYGQAKNNFPKFKWQSSFHDHVIRGEQDFYNHLNYIAINCIKHNLCKDEEKYKWSFLNEEFDDFID